MDAEVQKGDARSRWAVAAGAAMSVMGAPAVAQAAQFGGAPSVAAYTAMALLTVMAAAVMAVVVLEGAYRFRFVSAELRMRLRAHLRVVFGGTLLLALVTPYVALNFSVGALIPFVGAAGLIVAAWAWAASGENGFDTEITPPSEA